MDHDVMIEVANVTMKYKIVSEKVDSLKHYFLKRVKREIKYEDFYALRDVSFKVYKGEIFGIIGHNGAGKSTLLKIIAGILKPTSGSTVRNGTIAPLIELGAGFNNELNGIENIYLNGLLLGYSKKFIREKIDEIVEFADLGKFIYSPLKNYSSGMKARLGFSIATVIQPDILLVDEILSVGDMQFKQKSMGKIMSMIDSGTTVVFVSHSLTQLRQLCRRVLWLDKGAVMQIGNSEEVLQAYEERYGQVR